MLDQEYLREIIQKYKKEFQETHIKGIYKWKAVKCFQDNWDIHTESFSKMLRKALGMSKNLLAAYNYYSRKMICYFAEKQPETVRFMFSILYDEEKLIGERITNFIQEADKLYLHYYEKSHKNLSKTMDFLSMDFISVYLFLRFPEKYYLYNSRRYEKFAAKAAYPIPLGISTIEKIQSYFDMCNNMQQVVLQDLELLEMSRKRLSSDDYTDTSYHLLTEDIIYYEIHSEEALQNWWPSDKEYTPGLSKNDWKKLLNDKDVFHMDSLKIVKRILDSGGAATCKQLAMKYGKSSNFYNTGSVRLATRVYEASNCIMLKDNNENSKKWPVLYVGRHTHNFEIGSYIWKLRPELSAALREIDLSEIPLYEPSALRIRVELKSEQLEVPKSYSKKMFLAEVFLSEKQYDTLVSLLEHNKNIILQGAPGVGKTFAAKRLAYSIIGKITSYNVKIVQFHQSYCYEDFVVGYKPNENGFVLQKGIFYQYCLQAEKEPNEKFFLIIDEINRGNLSKIFGELLMMIEKDYRGETINLSYEGLLFSIPDNLYIIGMMNTADRSLAIIDYALRRRFKFFEMTPAFDREGFILHQRKMADKRFDALIEIIKSLNQEISRDISLGDSFCLGHSYFCGKDTCTNEWLSEIIEYDLVPLLKEYWFDDQRKWEIWASKLRGILYDE